MPPPTRLGYVWLIAANSALTGVTGERAGALVSFVASVATLIVTAFIGLRFFNEWSAVLGVWFLAMFPLDLVLACRCWQDGLMELAGALILYLAMRSYNSRGEWWPPIALAFAGSLGVLIKETFILLYVPCLAVALWTALSPRRDWRKLFYVATASVLGAAFCIAILVRCTGGLGTAMYIVQTTAARHAIHPYTLATSAGPGYRLLAALYASSPVIALLAACGILLTVFRPRESPALRLLAGMVAGFAGVFMAVPHWLNLRFISPIYAPICLFAGLALYRWLLFARHTLPPLAFRCLAAVTIIVVAVQLVADDRRMSSRFIRGGANDLSVGLVLGINGRQP